MKLFIIILSLFIFSCNSTSKPTAPNATEEAPKEVSVEERIQYEADSSIKVIYQVDTKTNTKHGDYKEYNSNTETLIVERIYHQNKIVGTEKLYFPNGKIQTILTYKDGIHHGSFKDFYPNGQLKQSGEYVEGKMEGILRGFYADGTLKEEVEHQEGVTQGPFKEYNENGTLKAEGNFTTKGEEESLEYGLIKLYDAEGIIDKKMVCKDGQCCTIWTTEKGAVKPSSKLCEAIIKELGEEVH